MKEKNCFAIGFDRILKRKFVWDFDLSIYLNFNEVDDEVEATVYSEKLLRSLVIRLEFQLML